MNRQVAAVMLASGLAMVGGASAASARLAACAHTDVAFYTTDTVRLATELAKSPSSCADYFVSIGPTATGAPRGGTPLTSVHQLGTHFHALAEVRLNAWAAYAATNGWFAAGVEVRHEMKAAGYDASLGDSWAINEIGAPSGTQMGVDVLNNAGTARRDFRDFVRGLYEGDDNVSEPGLVFAADPLQVTPDVTQYKATLSSWYADAPFWQDMKKYVHFWGQETYADARTWGVAGSTLAQRSAYLTDYFLHGFRLAVDGGAATEAARAFFAGAYLPLGNASYRWPAPDVTTGIGFGSTDVDPTVMQSFVSAQVYAMRSGSPSRFGFAFVPKSAAATDTLAVADRLGTAIQASEAAATAACAANGDACAASVDGAQFNDAWKTFANTLEGVHVTVRLVPAVTVTFATVTSRGSTRVAASSTRTVPTGYKRPPGTVAYDVETSATFAAAVVCFAVKAATYRGYVPSLFRLGAHGWVRLKTTAKPSAVCGSTRLLGTFAVFARPKHAG